jgi:hypothetical protein
MAATILGLDLDDVGDPKCSTRNLKKDESFSNEIWMEEVGPFSC